MRQAEGFADRQDPQLVHPRRRVRREGHPGLREEDPVQAEPQSHYREPGAGQLLATSVYHIYGTIVALVPKLLKYLPVSAA